MFALLLHVTVTREKYEQREKEEEDVSVWLSKHERKTGVRRVVR